MKAYDHKKIEKKWQEAWSKAQLYETKDSVSGKDNFYLLVEFPYPSGNLHVGHWYSFAVPDILARKLRMEGKNVLYPIGFDAFGLPAENAAIKNKVNPREWTEKNIEYMRNQIRSMGASFDWSREVVTSHPDYYRWTQWLFLQLYKAGLAYRKETMVNWCPNDKTVLANEQVVDGKCERCGQEVVQKEMLQWNIKMTDYADRLIDDLDTLNWPEAIKESQRNWIGRSEGAEIDFFLDFGDEKINAYVGPDGKKAHITVFTTRPDTVYGATYLVLAPEHPWVTLALQHKTVLKNNAEVQKYVDQANKKTELERQQETKEKTGVKLEGVEALNPATGERIPLFVADYVLAGYGTGAIMAVPAHDERDFEFAKKFNLPILQVIRPEFVDNANPPKMGKREVYRNIIEVFVRKKNGDTLLLFWKGAVWGSRTPVTGIVGGIEKGEDAVEAARREVLEETGYKNLVHIQTVSLEARTRFFAAHKDENRLADAIGVIFELENEDHDDVDPKELEKHEPRFVPEADVAKTLNVPDPLFLWNSFLHPNAYVGQGIIMNSGTFDGINSIDVKQKMTEEFGRRKTTYKLRDWIVSRQRYWGVPIPVVHCEKCGIVAVPEEQLPILLPETDDYLPDGKGKSPLAKVHSFVHVSCPKCHGKAERETDTFDTFVDSSWYFLRYTDPKNEKEFATEKKQSDWMPIDLYSGGAEHTTMHLLYSRFWQKALFDLKLVNESEPYLHRENHGLVLGTDGQKMSKSKGNVMDPDELVEKLGSDTVRLYLGFMGPYTGGMSYPWNPDSVMGIRRFLERVWKAQECVTESSKLDDKKYQLIERALHRSLKKVGQDILILKFNTAISQLMILLNAFEKERQIGVEQWQVFLKMLAPFAPHMAEELWHDAGKDTSVHLEEWPQFDASLLVDEEVVIAIQIDGKTRDEIRIANDSDKESVEKAAREKVAARLEGKNVVRTIIVPNRLVNFVTTS